MAIPVLFGLLAAAGGCRGSRSSAPGDIDAQATDASAGDAEGGVSASTETPTPADDAVPPLASEELTTRIKHLVEAIARDDPQLASDVEFPRDAWLGTRDAADPGKDWERRLAAPFRRDVHTLARRRKDIARAQSVSIEVGRALVQVNQRSHSWKKPLWTVRDSRITFVIDGRTRTLPVHEMTAWRGAWYVTRLR